MKNINLCYVLILPFLVLLSGCSSSHSFPRGWGNASGDIESEGVDYRYSYSVYATITAHSGFFSSNQPVEVCMWDTAWIFVTPSAPDNPWPYKHRFFTFTFSDDENSVADEISIDGVRRTIPKSGTFSYLYYNDIEGNIYELEVDKNDKKYQWINSFQDHETVKYWRKLQKDNDASKIIYRPPSDGAIDKTESTEESSEAIE